MSLGWKCSWPFALANLALTAVGAMTSPWVLTVLELAGLGALVVLVGPGPRPRGEGRTAGGIAMKGILQGLATTFGHVLRPAITERYSGRQARAARAQPSGFVLEARRRWELPVHGLPALRPRLPRGGGRGGVGQGGRGQGPQVTLHRIDVGRCMFCGLCVESCPNGALALCGRFRARDVRSDGDCTWCCTRWGPGDAGRAMAPEGEAEAPEDQGA